MAERPEFNVYISRRHRRDSNGVALNVLGGGMLRDTNREGALGCQRRNNEGSDEVSCRLVAARDGRKGGDYRYRPGRYRESHGQKPLQLDREGERNPWARSSCGYVNAAG